MNKAVFTIRREVPCTSGWVNLIGSYAAGHYTYEVDAGFGGDSQLITTLCQTLSQLSEYYETLLKNTWNETVEDREHPPYLFIANDETTRIFADGYTCEQHAKEHANHNPGMPINMYKLVKTFTACNMHVKEWR